MTLAKTDNNNGSECFRDQPSDNQLAPDDIDFDFGFAIWFGFVFGFALVLVLCSGFGSGFA